MKMSNYSKETEVRLKDFKHPWNNLGKRLDKDEKVCIIDKKENNSGTNKRF